MLTQRIKNFKTISLLFLLVILSAVIGGTTYSMFHLMSFILLLYVLHSFYKNYFRHKTINSLLVFISFFSLTLAQVFFSMIAFYTKFYVVGEVLQLLGYLILLISMIKVIKNA
jgi:hypothetical protein